MAYGLEPFKTTSGGEMATNVYGDYTLASGYATNLFEGDLLVVVAGGDVERAAAGDTLNVGVFWGVQYTNTDGEEVFSRTWTASTTTLGSADVKVLVWDDPDMVFKIEADQAATALLKTAIHGNIDIVVGTGSTVSKKSGTYIDSSVGTAAGAAQLRILGSAELDGAWTAAGTAQDVFCMINEHVYKSTTGV